MEINYSYLILLLFFFFLAYLDRYKYNSNVAYFTIPQKITFISYVLFWGLRGFIGTDCFWYYQWFQELNVNLVEAFRDRMDLEPGYITYAYIFKYHLWNNFHAFIFFSTLLNALFLHFIFKKSGFNIYILSFAIFVAFCANSEINNLRNIRAILLFFISIKFIEERRFLPFFLIQIIGLLFHSTSIFYIPLFFILCRNLKKWILPVVIIGFILVVGKLSPLTTVINRVAELLKGEYLVKALIFMDMDEPKGFSLGAISRLSLGLLLWYYYDKLSVPRQRIYCNLTLMYLFCFSFFNEIPVFRLRFSMMFAPALCVVIPLFIKYSNYRNRKIVTLYLLLLTISQAIVNFQGSLFHYDNLLWGIGDINVRYRKFV